jgi:hypothetical protein
MVNTLDALQRYFSDNSLYTDNMVDKIEDAEIAYEKQEGILAWRGSRVASCTDTGSELHS